MNLLRFCLALVDHLPTVGLSTRCGALILCDQTHCTGQLLVPLLVTQWTPFRVDASTMGVPVTCCLNASLFVDRLTCSLHLTACSSALVNIAMDVPCVLVRACSAQSSQDCHFCCHQNNWWMESQKKPNMLTAWHGNVSSKDAGQQARWHFPNSHFHSKWHLWRQKHCNPTERKHMHLPLQCCCWKNDHVATPTKLPCGRTEEFTKWTSGEDPARSWTCFQWQGSITFWKN